MKRASLAGVLLLVCMVALGATGAIAQGTAAPTPKMAAVPFAALPGVDAELSCRFWSGVMDQLEGAPVELLTGGTLARWPGRLVAPDRHRRAGAADGGGARGS